MPAEVESTDRYRFLTVHPRAVIVAVGRMCARPAQVAISLRNQQFDDHLSVATKHTSEQSTGKRLDVETLPTASSTEGESVTANLRTTPELPNRTPVVMPTAGLHPCATRFVIAVYHRTKVTLPYFFFRCSHTASPVVSSFMPMAGGNIGALS